MNRLLQICVLSLLMIGCPLHGGRELRMILPAEIVVKNVSAKPFTIQRIYSTSDAEGGFMLKGGELPPGENLTRNVTESSFDIFVSKEYVIEVKCPSKEVLSIKGESVEAKENKEYFALELFLNTCQ